MTGTRRAVRRPAGRTRPTHDRALRIGCAAAVVALALTACADSTDRAGGPTATTASSAAPSTTSSPSTTATATQTTPSTTRPRTSTTSKPAPKPTSRPSPKPTPKPSPKPKPMPKPSPKPSPTPPSSGGVAGQVLSLVNSERARAGCRAVRANSALQTAAQRHSADMAAKDYFSHTSKDGRTFADRIRAAGYRGSTIGENIAAGQTTASAVMKSWMASSGHRANILNCSFTALGVGHATGGSYGHYWTQDFGG
ncbi:Uncharacterized conserved protein YkwD, contains CAP (CSP/antigen 5/PR1) domain [Pedococcus dokdonensis]|uniref:Uncharacterized conserved protein YkwD, contains CAP (CSP/antigen 5/PR1) domain n=1 Tax=Pedococcus dokdonensis TaxID=443156 RepID=A0A1H0QWY8_9MICO|nr:CAP domain-containing protein [Pedococcus dokdonensis]SDP21399.1 Uncharacterized conserved protein YkwD, contains CAP (CSP/antigen 5/PR1) domain [Pedococcus dokdonensis]